MRAVLPTGALRAGHSPSPQLWSEAQRLFWRQVLLQHLVPPHPTYKALWTAPFLDDGVQLDTELHVKYDLICNAPMQSVAIAGCKRDIAPVPSTLAGVRTAQIASCPTFRPRTTQACRARQFNSSAVMAPLTARAVSSRIFVQAQASIALVVPQELPACKAFVLEIDYPLLPFPAATPVDRQVLQPLQLPPTCSGELGANYQGEEIANAQLGAHLVAACLIHALRRSAIVEASVVHTARAIWCLTRGIGGKK